MQAVIDATGAPEHEARQAVAETSDLQGAVRHAAQAAVVRMYSNHAADLREKAEILIAP